MVDGQRNTDVSICRLCSASHRYSIILNIRNYDTFARVRQAVEEDTAIEVKDDIDAFIQTTIRDHKFNLLCLNESRNKQCPAMIRLCKCLIQYKRWLYTVCGSTEKRMDKTIQVDLARVDNETFRKVFIQSAEALPKLQKSQIDAIVQMMKDNDTYRTDSFMQVTKKEFYTELKTKLGIKPGVGCRLRAKIKTSLQIKAQQAQFGEFLSVLDIQSVQKDYHHVLRSHIHSGNQELIKNAFSFFSKI
eukprot:457702_1